MRLEKSLETAYKRQKEEMEIQQLQHFQVTDHMTCCLATRSAKIKKKRTLNMWGVMTFRHVSLSVFFWPQMFL